MGRPLAVRHTYALMRSAINADSFPPEHGRSFSEQDAVDFFGSSRTETREALDQLTRDGLLERSPRRGTKVRFVPVSWSLTRGLIRPERHRVRVEELQPPVRIAATRVLAAAFGRDLAELWQRDETFLVDGTRVCLRSSYWDAGDSGRPVILPRDSVPLAESFSQAYGKGYGGLDSVMTALSADARQAAVLGVPEGEPLLWRQTILSDEDGIVQEISQSFYLASRVYFEVDGSPADAFGI